MTISYKSATEPLFQVVSESKLFEIDKDSQKLRWALITFFFQSKGGMTCGRLADESERKKWAQAPARALVLEGLST